MSDYSNLIQRLREYSNARKGEIAELTGEAADALERESGEWICDRIDFQKVKAPGVYVVSLPTCSLCRHQVTETTNFCPNCGADMREPPKEGE